MKRVILGNCGLEVSRLGMGVMPVGPNQLSLPLDEGAAVVRYALEAGIDFLDTAQYYHTYPYIKEALRGGHRRPVISSKSLAPDRRGMERAIEEARLALDLDVIDIFLLHEVRSGDFAVRIGAWEALQACFWAAFLPTASACRLQPSSLLPSPAWPPLSCLRCQKAKSVQEETPPKHLPYRLQTVQAGRRSLQRVLHFGS